MKIILIIALFINILLADIFTDDEKRKAIKQVNLNLPMRLNESTTLVNFSIIDDTFSYMANVDKRNFFSNKEKKSIKQQTIKGVCTDKRSLVGLKRGLRYNYSYRNKNTYKVFYQFNITIKDCEL